MATDWNPNSPDVIGLEWFPVVQGERVLNANGKSAALRIRSTATETIEQAWIPTPVDMQQKVGKGRWLMEVYEEGDELPGRVRTATYYPNNVTANADDAWKDQDADPIPVDEHTPSDTEDALHGSISEVDYSAATYIQYTGTYQQRSVLRVCFDTTHSQYDPIGDAAWASGRRVVGGRLVVIANRSEGAGRLLFTYRPPPPHANFALGAVTLDEEFRTYEIPWPELNPATGLPWTKDDIDDLDTGGASIRVKPISIGKHKPARIYQMYLELDYVTENRVAVGIVDVDRENISSAVLSHPTTGADGWSKANGTTYTFLVRRTPKWSPVDSSTDLDAFVLNGGSMGWRFLEESVPVGTALGRDAGFPDPYMESYSPILNGDGTIAAMGESGTRGYGLVLTTAEYGSGQEPGDSLSVDGQGYFGLWVRGHGSDYPEGDAGQYLTFSAGGVYDALRFVGNAADLGDDVLEVTITKVGGAELTQFTLTADELAEIGEPLTGTALTDDVYGGSQDATPEWMVFTHYFASPLTFAAASQYAVGLRTQDSGTFNFLSASGTIETGGGFRDNLDYGDATFGGETDYDEEDDPSGDVLVQVLNAPAAPTMFTVSTGTHDVMGTEPTNTPDWLIRTVEYAQMTWDGTELADSFLAYEIERSEDAGVTWNRIFRITDESVTEARDYESPRNTEVLYRMRVVSSIHVASSWTDEESFTAALDDCALLFVSNEDPTLNLGYVDTGGSRTYTFLGSDEREYHVLQGLDYQVVTAPLEYRGDRFDANLAVWAGVEHPNVGRAMFDPLVALMNAPLSYVCVMDETGRRWFADVVVKEGQRTGNKVHEAPVTVTELTATPSVVDVEPELVDGS